MSQNRCVTHKERYDVSAKIKSHDMKKRLSRYSVRRLDWITKRKKSVSSDPKKMQIFGTLHCDNYDVASFLLIVEFICKKVFGAKDVSRVKSGKQSTNSEAKNK